MSTQSPFIPTPAAPAPGTFNPDAGLPFGFNPRKRPGQGSRPHRIAPFDDKEEERIRVIFREELAKALPGLKEYIAANPLPPASAASAIEIAAAAVMAQVPQPQTPHEDSDVADVVPAPSAPQVITPPPGAASPAGAPTTAGTAKPSDRLTGSPPADIVALVDAMPAEKVEKALVIANQRKAAAVRVTELKALTKE